jgi:hypothetical protein
MAQFFAAIDSGRVLRSERTTAALNSDCRIGLVTCADRLAAGREMALVA